MTRSLNRLMITIIIIAVGTAAGLGYAINSDLLSEKESNLVKSQFLISDLNREEDPNISEEDLSNLVDGNSEFTLDLYQKIQDDNGNLFYSPYSISLALAMTTAGAEGETQQQIADTLNFELSEDRLHKAFNYLDQALRENNDENFTLNIANSFWGQENYHFEEDYLNTLALNYGAGVRLLDFMREPESSRQTINKWVENETEQKIKDLIPKGAIDSLTRAVLTNAIYFNASWRLPFEESNTVDGIFTLLNGDETEVKMMGQTETFKYAEGSDYQAVELPYQGNNNTAMLIISPDRSQFEEFESNLDTKMLDEIVEKLEDKSVSLKMPRFEYEADLNLTKTLKQMGMPAAFNPSKANFSGMTGDNSLYVTDVLHKAFVSVDEEGTEASAATAVVFGETSVPTKSVEMNLDSPFIFLIRDNDTGTVLFIGRLMNPNA